jgi:hypothetical protein
MMKAYMILFALFVVIFCSIKGPLAWGEYDDYTLPAASLLNDYNFSITESDINYYNKLFPEREEINANTIKTLSGYQTRGGEGTMTWYFPTYAIISLPLVLTLHWLNLPASYGFMYTNLLLVMILLIVVYKYLIVSNKKKMAVILMPTINPMIFYIPWLSAEVVIFAFLGLMMVSWYNNWYKRAAIFLSIAGTLNATVMTAGFIMILEYLVTWIKNKASDKTILAYIKSNFLEIIKYGCCYIIGIVPMIYNYYNVGYINLTASYPAQTIGRESVLQRFRSYFIDLNYGYIPYYGILLILTIVLFAFAFRKRQWRYIGMIVAFVCNVLLYSLMVNINCGGTGIARYSSWCGVLFVLAAVFYYDAIVNKPVLKRVAQAMIGINIAILSIIIYVYGPYAASNTWSNGLDPITKYTLDNYPGIYNPLGSSFYAETNHCLAGYDYETPIVYTDDNGYVRKILAAASDKEQLIEEYAVSQGDSGWFADQVNALSDTESYISVPTKIHVVKSIDYIPGTDIVFAKEGNTASQYADSGIYEAEDWGSWTSDKAVLSMTFPQSDVPEYRCSITCGVYNEKQHVKIFVNNELVFDQFVKGYDGIEFTFKNPSGLCEIRIELLNARIAAPGDGRVLGLSISQALIY